MPIWIATAFQAQNCPKHNTIVFRASRDILDAFHLAPNGQQYRRLLERFEHVFNATIYVELQKGNTRVVERYQLMQRLALTIGRRDACNQYNLWQSQIVLDPYFAEQLRSSPVPIDLETVIALKDKPSALDLYIWQSYRSWTLAQQGRKRHVAVPLDTAVGLFAQLGYQIQSHARAVQSLKIAQRYVRAAWPECRNGYDPKTGRFLVYPSRAVHRQARIQLPGVRNPPPPQERIIAGKADLTLERS
ncbi:MAG: hypothetical protein MJE77_08300 [Proteobacteria bacterium]|nr:hypothetical protein [Pseudomonadota bacterium]